VVFFVFCPVFGVPVRVAKLRMLSFFFLLLTPTVNWFGVPWLLFPLVVPSVAGTFSPAPNAFFPFTLFSCGVVGCLFPFPIEISAGPDGFLVVGGLQCFYWFLIRFCFDVSRCPSPYSSECTPTPPLSLFAPFFRFPFFSGVELFPYAGSNSPLFLFTPLHASVVPVPCGFIVFLSFFFFRQFLLFMVEVCLVVTRVPFLPLM